MGIQRTYYDGNREDRAYVRGFWTWLAQQPQQAWLYYAGRANWDQAEDMFVDMVQHPRCDRALASWLFWSSCPSYFIKHGKRTRSEKLLGATLDRRRLRRTSFDPGPEHRGRRSRRKVRIRPMLADRQEAVCLQGPACLP